MCNRQLSNNIVDKPRNRNCFCRLEFTNLIDSSQKTIGNKVFNSMTATSLLVIASIVQAFRNHI